MRYLITLVIAGCIVHAPLPPRPQKLYVVRTPDNITVTVLPADAVAWRVRAQNDREQAIRLIWDESSFIDHSGLSEGRLLRGKTRVIDSTKPQMSSGIAPHAFIDEWCIPESAPEYEENLANQHGGQPPLPEAVRVGVGRMFLVFETDKGRETWEGQLSFDGSTPPIAKPPASKPPADIEEPPKN